MGKGDNRRPTLIPEDTHERVYAQLDWNNHPKDKRKPEPAHDPQMDLFEKSE